MTKDKYVNEGFSQQTSFTTGESCANQYFDAACLAHYLDSIGNDLEAAPRDPDEGLRQYAERLQSVVQDARFALNDELDQLEHDLENVIDHLDGEEVS